MKILIVDDNESVRKMIKEFIKDQVNEFVECDDGSRALASYVKHCPDLVLMDIQMADVDGLKATRDLKNAFSEARVVIVSQFDSPALREAAKQAGAEDYICKWNLIPLRKLCKPDNQD